MVLCAKFLLFDPADLSLPMYKFPFDKDFVASCQQVPPPPLLTLPISQAVTTHYLTGSFWP